MKSIRVATPCSADWNRMLGDDRVRFCAECSRHVYNLSGMSAHEATELISRRRGRLCVRFYQRTDGTVLTEDCPAGLRAAMRRVARVAGIAFSVLASTGLAAAQTRVERPTQTLGSGTSTSPTSDIKALAIQGEVIEIPFYPVEPEPVHLDPVPIQPLPSKSHGLLWRWVHAIFHRQG